MRGAEHENIVLRSAVRQPVGNVLALDLEDQILVARQVTAQQGFARLPLGLKLTKSNSLKDLLRAHEIGKINKAIAADSANANGASSNGSPTTVANEHPLFNANAFGDDDEEILSLNNLPDNVDLNDLSVELDDSYLVF